MQFEASRLSDGNKLFPARIIIEPIGITLKLPGLFGGKEKTIPFHLISSVKLKTPFIGYSTIIIYSVGWDIITASGFTAADVTTIKKQIEIGQDNYKKQRTANSITSANFVENSQSNSVVSQANSETNLTKWKDDLVKLSDLTDDEIITEEEFKSQKSILLLKLSQDSSLVLTDALRMLKDLEEEDIITEIEFNETKQNLMKPKPLETTINPPIIESTTHQVNHSEHTSTIINSPIIEAVTPQINNQESSNIQISSSQQNTTPQKSNSESISTEQVDKLIEMALMDGVLTEKEKQILFKKAEAAGIDLDEFEMILDAKLFEKQQSIKAAAPPVAAPKSDKHGDVNKCPACGSMIQGFTAICADCGHNFSNINAVSSVTKLYEQLQMVESEERNRPIVESGGWIDKLQGSSAMNHYNMEERILKRKASVVSGFPIPNTKEDILEFLSMALPEVGKKPGFLMMKTATGAVYNAWHSKAEQVVMKARFSLKEDKKLLEEINNYAIELGIK
jgi:hypothetical protein